MRKEIMVSADSKTAAVNKLCKSFDKYLTDNEIKNWKWLIKPEVKQRRPGNWRAYGRIEFEREGID